LLLRVATLVLVAVAPLATRSATETYTYDNAGRLITVDHGDGRTTTYTLDPAGNRTALQTSAQAAPPDTITVPASSATGSYSISWTASVSAGVTAYKLWEATNAAFTDETLVHTGSSPASITGRADGTYYYRVQSCEGAVCGPHRAASNPIVVASPPGAPASITAPASNFTGSYSISWTAPSSGTVTGYEVQEATNVSFTSPTSIYTGASLSTSVSGRSTATTYYYRVRACNGAACSGYIATSGTLVTLPPSTPASLTNPSGDPDGTYDVSWTTVSGPVTAYELWEATNSSFTGETRVYNSTGSLVSLTGRANGTYYYRVRACNAGGCGGYRQGATPTTVALPPGLPQSITVPAASSTGSYSISWTAPASGAFTGYELYESTSATFTSQSQVYSGAATSASVTGRTNGTYYYRVRACNGGSCGGYREGAAGIVVTMPPATPATITNPGADADGAYDVSWATVSGPVTAYELWEATNSSFTGETLVYNSTGSLASLTGRANGTYYYRVRACNAGGCSGYRTVSGATTVTLPPGMPQTITVPAASNTGTYTISWTAPSGGTVTSYELYESTSATFTSQTQVYTGASLSTAISGRANGTYYYRVRGCNVGGCGGYREGSAGIVVTLPPATPASISFASPDYDGSYTLTWSAVAAPVSSYEVYEATNSGFSGETQVYSGSSTSAAISGRGNGSYYYRVRACNAGGCSGFVAASGAMTVALTPNAPASIAVPGSAYSGSYTIGWSAPSGSVVTGYELYESATSNFASQTLVSSTAGTSATLSNSNVTLYYRVRACNGSGNCGAYATGANGIVISPASRSRLTAPRLFLDFPRAR
jgi:YD repeat-containing protein